MKRLHQLLRLRERKEGCKYCCYYYLYYYCCQYKCSTGISISKFETIYYRAEEKKTRRKAETLHQLQMKINIFIHTTSYLPSTNQLTGSLQCLIHNMVASYFLDEIADNIFDQERRKMMSTSNLTSYKTKREHRT